MEGPNGWCLGWVVHGGSGHGEESFDVSPVHHRGRSRGRGGWGPVVHDPTPPFGGPPNFTKREKMLLV